MKFVILLILSLASSEVFSQCNGRYNANIFPTGSDLTTYTYGENTRYNGDIQSLKLDLYQPKSDTATMRPCIVFCFGGAFVQGSRTSFELSYIANILAPKGFVCASIDYRLDDTSNFRINGINGESGAAIRAVQDAKAAIRYLKSKADELRIDTNQIFLGGTSAGGITALTAGYSQYDEFTSVVKSVINGLGGWEGTTNTLSHSSKVKGLFNFSGAVFDTTHIGSQDLPVYLNHATKDETVPFYSGFPLNGQSATMVHGSGLIAIRAKNQGLYYMIDSFKTTFHPAFINSTDIISTLSMLNSTGENLRKFLYEVIGCNKMHMGMAKSDSKLLIQNPISDFIILPEFTKPESLKIYNQLGQNIMSIKTIDNKIQVSNFHSGIYFLEFNGITYKIIKE